VGTLLLVIVVLTILAVVASGVVRYLSTAPDRNELREARAETAAVKSREKIATKALRSIANGAGNPVLEAQDALDLIETTYTKELN
jgi:type II secretory pathway pseudopilin PulG